METLVAMEDSIRQDKLEQERKRQRAQMNQRHNDQHFDGGVSPTDQGSAFTDDYTKSVYAQIRANDAKMRDNMVHATSSAPYHQGRKIK